MEGLLHYTISWKMFVGVCAMVLLTDVIDWIVDKWEEK